MRKWFPSEFSWRVYVVLQMPALLAYAVFFAYVLANGDLLKYRSIYDYSVLNVTAIEQLCKEPPPSQIDTWLDRDLSLDERQSRCRNAEVTRQARYVGKKLAGISSDMLAAVVIWLLLAIVVPFALLRVPTWLWEGWRR